ncbi:hypothetical protein E2C01_092879 [Portunus trituberculatus]|uniref:Uncharacterized protein n=1 Tax=Portunus trituberculatus TaxID=210409 RepID=A0A5B7JRU9_PORTR|nr:hypothetical protein [Portunus trituberculatus]
MTDQHSLSSASPSHNAAHLRRHHTHSPPPHLPSCHTSAWPLPVSRRRMHILQPHVPRLLPPFQRCTDVENRALQPHTCPAILCLSSCLTYRLSWV